MTDWMSDRPPACWGFPPWTDDDEAAARALDPFDSDETDAAAAR